MVTGLDASAPEESGEARLRVEGTDCASCVAKVEMALSRVPDISSVTVNFAAETVTLKAANANALERAQATIRMLGYHAKVLERSEALGRGREIYPESENASRASHIDAHEHSCDHAHAPAGGLK